MRTEQIEGHRRVILDPGEWHASREPLMISTLLGSCVAACLYDPVARVFGMNHFMLSNRRYAKEMPVCASDAGRYGINAMELLINGMLKLGARKTYIKAKAFGGGSIIPMTQSDGNFFCVGDVNARFIREFLDNEGIPLLTSDLGGERGRVVHFSGIDFSAYVRKIVTDRSQKLALRDRELWMKTIDVQEATDTAVDLW